MKKVGLYCLIARSKKSFLPQRRGDAEKNVFNLFVAP